MNHQRRAAISIPDSFLIVAAEPNDSVASADAAVIAVARNEGIGVIPLPDSAGRRPR